MPRIFNVVSPHLDDVALSCTLFLSVNRGSHITTVFSGGPQAVEPLPAWDRASRYFRPGADVMAVRRGEDISAAAMIAASVRHLNFWDVQYRTAQYGYDGMTDPELPGAIADQLVSVAGDHPADGWLVPLGIDHPDHVITAEACLLFASEHPVTMYVYEELPYSTEKSKAAAERKRLLAERGFVLDHDADAPSPPRDRSLKAAVIRCHASQRRALGRRIRTALYTRERIWRLTRA
jgi:LmbE family N-acetylglucosaminyl deacetylase